MHSKIKYVVYVFSWSYNGAIDACRTEWGTYSGPGARKRAEEEADIVCRSSSHIVKAIVTQRGGARSNMTILRRYNPDSKRPDPALNPHVTGLSWARETGWVFTHSNDHKSVQFPNGRGALPIKATDNATEKAASAA